MTTDERAKLTAAVKLWQEGEGCGCCGEYDKVVEGKLIIAELLELDLNHSQLQFDE